VSDPEPISRLSYRTLRRCAAAGVTTGRTGLPGAGCIPEERFGVAIRPIPRPAHRFAAIHRHGTRPGAPEGTIRPPAIPVTGVWRCRHAASVPSADQDGFPPFFVAETRSKPVEIQVTIGKKA
jgi:hypothetical protein